MPIKRFSYQNSTYNITEPNTCPFCHVTQIASNISLTPTTDKSYIIGTWTCVNDQCLKLFTVQHSLHRGTGNHTLINYLQGTPIIPEWPGVIKELNSRFDEIYRQSAKAEEDGLYELAGMGYRKAIEFLVKDYALSNHPDKGDAIGKDHLGKVIGELYQGELQAILKLAVYLGNDETHFIRLHEDFDIEDLKELINLVTAEMDAIAKKAHYKKNLRPKT